MYTVQAHIYLPMSKRDNEAYLDMFAFGTWNATIILPDSEPGLGENSLDYFEIISARNNPIKVHTVNK